MENSKSAIVILAAGKSSRLGQPKQLLKYQDKSLLEIAVQKSLSICKNVIVVIGKHEEAYEEIVEAYDVTLITNSAYEEGLSTSIVVAINALEDYESVLIMLCDQPLIPKEHFMKLLDSSNKSNQISCSFYNDKLAVPAVFPKRYFSLLKALKGDKGAKSIIMQNEHTSIMLDNNLALDIDTKEDVEVLYQNN